MTDRIFISCNASDMDFANLLRAELMESGVGVSVSSGSIYFKAKWLLSLDQAIADVDVVVLLISHGSLQQKTLPIDFQLADAYSKINGNPVVVSIGLDDVKVPSAYINNNTKIFPGRDARLVAEILQQVLAEHKTAIMANHARLKEAAKKIEDNAPAYIEKAIGSQKKLELTNGRYAHTWYGVGFGSLIIGIGYVVYSLSLGSAENISILQLIRLLISNAIIVGFLGACARYAFTLGKSYTTESLKASDRIHAIAFGQFYLEAFGAQAGWSELKEVFAHWNIDRSSNFAAIDVAQIDPQVLSTITQIAGALAPKKQA